MDRRETLVGGIDLASHVVAEIGALCNPLLTKAEADVRYVDYADTEALRKHYAGDPHVALDRIVETDAIWGEKTLIDALGQRVDFILASHVIEHVPDLVTWLNELRSAITEGGQVRLAIPDKRFTFDFLRRETELSDVLAAYLISPRVPQPQAILDFYLNVVEVDHAAAWRGEVSEETVKRPNTFETAMQKAKESFESGVYHDAHCWVFTPRSFAILLGRLCELGLLPFGCASFHDTEPNTIEFFVSLQVTDDVEEATRSWRRMAESVRVYQPSTSTMTRSELSTAIQSGDLTQRERQIHALHEAELRETRDSLERVLSEITLLRRSKSWQLTRPLRSLSTTLRRWKGN